PTTLSLHDALPICRPTTQHHFELQFRAKANSKATEDRGRPYLSSPKIGLCCFTAVNRTQLADRYFHTAWFIRMGDLRTRLPVAANTAFATAGAIGGTGGSPTPIGCSVLGTM